MSANLKCLRLALILYIYTEDIASNYTFINNYS